jgi:2-polyprenyl-3-methyl-5-hydroxy-6-metoxy-1,4-benzoquinol methylase
MKSNQDAFGKHLLAQYEAKLKGETIIAEIVERDDNYIDFGSHPGMYFSEYEDWPNIEQQIIDRVQGKVLDIGCGAGRHSLYLQEKGLDVTGIDNSTGAIEVCRLRGLKNTFVYSIDEIDKFEPGSFDTIIMLGNNFGLFGDGAKAKLILQKMHTITTPDAQIIVKTLNPYLTDDEAHLKYQRWNKERGRMTGQIRLRVRYYQYTGEWFDYLFVSPEEMESILKDTDWKITEFINSEEAQYFAIFEKK